MFRGLLWSIFIMAKGSNLLKKLLGESFYISFCYHDFAKIYGPPEILQNYTSVVVAHDVREIAP
jgi:hypothetical protein